MTIITESFSCMYRGDALGTGVYSCAVFGKCVLRLSKHVVGQGICRICEYRKPAAVIDPQFTCTHRGLVLRQHDCGCGGAVPRIEVLDCELHGECTVHGAGRAIPKSDKNGRVPACVACPDRDPIQQEVACSCDG